MRKLVLLIIGVLMLTAVNAQWSDKYKIHYAKKHFLYGTSDVLLGNYNGGDIAINYIYNSKYSVNFGFSVSSKSASNQFTESLKSANINSIDNNIKAPKENLENFRLMLGRVIRLSPKGNSRIIIQAGSGVSTIREPVLKKHIAGFPNSHVGFQSRQQVSLIINPKIEFPVTPILGFSVGPLLIVNDERYFLGLSIGVLYGIISNRTG